MKNVEAVLSVKFKSSHPPAKLAGVCGVYKRRMKTRSVEAI
jgi:hypothetical protein